MRNWWAMLKNSALLHLRLRGRHGGYPLQRGSHRLLHFSIRGCFSVCAIPASQRQCPPAEIPRHLARFQAVKGGPLDPSSGPSDLFDLRPRGNVHALPRFGLHGRQHARSVYRRLREVFRANGYSLSEHAAALAIGLRGTTDSNPIPRSFTAEWPIAGTGRR